MKWNVSSVAHKSYTTLGTSKLNIHSTFLGISLISNNWHHQERNNLFW